MATTPREGMVTRPVDLIVPSTAEMPLTFANATHVSYTDREFVVSFFQVSPPVGPEEDGGPPIQGSCITRIVITPEVMAELVESSNQSLAAYRLAMAAEAQRPKS